MRRSRRLHFKLSLTSSLLLFVLFIFCAATAAAYHEIWVDEAHHWLLGRDSSSISNMIFNARYEGHPVLWNLVLYLITRITLEPIWMQYANLVIASIAVFLFLRSAPFSILFKILFISGYFVLYEYGVIARNYAMLMLFLFLTVLVYHQRWKKQMLWLLILAFLANTHLFGLIIALAFILPDFFDRKTFTARFYILFIASIALSVWQIITPSDHMFKWTLDGIFTAEKMGKAVSSFWRGFFPLQDLFSFNTWNSNFLLTVSKPLVVILSVVTALLSFLHLHTDRKLFAFYVFATGGIVLFIWISPLILSVRHCGFLFLLFISTWWISKSGAPKRAEQDSTLLQKTSNGFLWITVIIQATAGLFAVKEDIAKPFSAAKEVAEYLKHERKNTLVLVSNHGAGPSLSAYLKASLYYPEVNCSASYCSWNTTPFIIHSDTLKARISRLQKTTTQTLTIVLNQPKELIGIKEDSLFRLQILEKFEESLVKNERYYVYELAD